jgi:conjugal transfer pilus assembly protein TraK
MHLNAPSVFTRFLLLCVWLIASTFAATVAQAQVIVDVGTGKTVEVVISRNDLNRIGLFGGKLSDLKYKQGELDAQPEPRTGAYFLLPTVNTKVSVFLTSASGQVHHLVLRPENVEAQSIVLREPTLEVIATQRAPVRAPNAPEARPTPTTTQSLGRSNSLDAAIKRLVTSLARNERPSDLRFVEQSKELVLWEGSRFWLMSSLVSATHIGDHFRLQNAGTGVIRLDEREFYKRGVVAVAMELHTLAPGEATDVYVVRENDDQK